MLTTFVSVALLSLAAAQEPPVQGPEAPVSTAPSAIRAQPAPPPAEPPAPPTGDYTYVAECFGSLSGFLDARPRVLPEVERIEATWAGKIGSTTAEQAMADYRQMGVQAEKDQAQLRRALAAAEGASPRTLVASSQNATASARAKWGMKDTKALAREWMSWTLPERCLAEAAVLEQRSTLNTALLRGTQAEPAAQPSAADTAPRN